MPAFIDGFSGGGGEEYLRARLTVVWRTGPAGAPPQPPARTSDAIATKDDGRTRSM
jgi:hypothetical protein